ncbi:MAG: type IV toxin-antitoxin system AbiEi family antitoxin [Desulfobacterales bacterium]
MKLSIDVIGKRAVEALNICLNRVPFLKIAEIREETSLEGVPQILRVKIVHRGGVKNLMIALMGNGQPRLARQAVNQLLRTCNEFQDVYGVFVAPYISAKSADICSSEEVGYLDLAGNCRLCFDEIYIEQEGKSNVFTKKRDLRSLYSPRAERILRVLLNNSKKVWKTQELAKEAQVSLGQVSNVKKLLFDREWIQIEKKGFLLSSPESLLKDWAENYSFEKNRITDYYSLKDVAEIETELASLCSRKGLLYAFTCFSGAARLAPTVRYKKIFSYIEETKEDVTWQLGLRKVSAGANLSLLSPYDQGVFSGSYETHGVRIASPVQIYLDLSCFRGHGEEAAQALLNQGILT